MKKICVIGSINMDLVIETEYPPVMGETVFGKGFKTVPGGKGANQAVAAALLGNEVSFIGAVGKDSFGEQLGENLKSFNVDVSGVECIGTSGIAMIVVSGGDNTIILESGANNKVTPEFIDRNIDLIKKSDIVIFQLEIPSETVLYAMKAARALGKTVLLNPAPVSGFLPEMLGYTDILVANEHEASAMLDMKITETESAKNACGKYLGRGVKQIIITLGANGCVYNRENEIRHAKAFKVKAVDSTAAGDSFIGAFCAKYKNTDVDAAVKYAQATSAIVVSRKGASTSIPTREEVEEFLSRETK